MTTATAPPPAAAAGTFTILAADKLAEQGLAYIESQPDATLLNKPGLSEAEYAELVAGGGIHAMIVRSGIKVTAAMLENPGDLKVIARAGVGVDNIDLPAATAKGILVVNTAEASTLTTAEHALALLLALARNVGPAYRTMADGGWDRSKFSGTQLAGKTLGVVGFGRIGQTVAKRALAFDMEVVAFDPFIAAERMLDGQVRMFRDFTAMLPECDIVSFHVPLNEHTKGMLNAETFALAKDGLLVVNAARGGVVDEDAIIPAIESGKCGGAALDVFTDEPPPADSPLRTHPKVLVTPHLGASTKEAQVAVSTDAGAAVLAYLRGEGIKGAVNAGGVRVDLTPPQQRYVDLAERMAALICPMCTRGISEVTIELNAEGLHPAAGTLERTVLIGLLRPALDVPLNVINVGDVADRRGIKVKTVTVDDDEGATSSGGGGVVITIKGPAGSTDATTDPADRVRRIAGRVMDDHRPRVTEINGYHMDMVPSGPMVLIQNADQPGMIGLVGSEFGEAGVNIADMSISRRPSKDGKMTALMVLNTDTSPDDATVARLKARPGILKVATVVLAEEPGS